MRGKRLGISGALCVTVLLASCNYYHPKGELQEGPTEGGPNTGNPTGGEPGEVPRAATFADISTTVFTPYCSRCHKGDEPAGGISVVTYADLIDGGVLEPGKPDESLIYTVMIPDEDGKVSMPKRGTKPSAELIESVKLWIENGALEK